MAKTDAGNIFRLNVRVLCNVVLYTYRSQMMFDNYTSFFLDIVLQIDVDK